MNPQERHPHGLKKITIHSFFVQTPVNIGCIDSNIIGGRH